MHDSAISTTQIDLLYLVQLKDAASDNQKDRIIAAIRAIADARKSDAIYKFLENGQIPCESQTIWLRGGADPSSQTASDPVQEVIPVSIDRPAGLQNIGNTCYLNSLLQYFFTIRELREVVLGFERYRDDSESGDAVPPKRVGGREVTRKEVERSKRFVQHLSSLFSQLIYMAEPAVRPELDLAYLALVSSKDEDEATSPKEAPIAVMPVGTDVRGAIPTTASPPALAVKDQAIPVDAAGEGLIAAQAHAMPPSDPSPPSAGSPSVLGKRNSEHLDDEEMDIDRQSRSRSAGSPEKTSEETLSKVQQTDATVMDVDPSPSGSSERPESTVELQQDEIAAKPGGSEAAEMAVSSQPPPLPPRPEQTRKATTVTNSTMMFGKQNDVSEAMDNVIFQIEAALDERKLLNAQGGRSSRADNRGFIQSLFYGSSRQSLDFGTGVQDRRVKDETFSYLLVDVASEGKDLYDGLDASLQTSIVEVEGKQATRTDVLTHLPPILQIQLQRVQFDRKTAKIFKSNAYMSFPETLKMGRFLAPNSEETAATDKYEKSGALRRAVVSAREKLERLKEVDEDKVSHLHLFSALTYIVRHSKRPSRSTEIPKGHSSRLWPWTMEIKTQNRSPSATNCADNWFPKMEPLIAWPN